MKTELDYSYHKELRRQCPRRRVSTCLRQFVCARTPNGRKTHAARGVAALIVEELGLQYVVRHGLDVLFRIVFRDGGQNEQAFANGGYELAVDGDRSRFNSLQYSCRLLSDRARRSGAIWGRGTSHGVIAGGVAFGRVAGGGKTGAGEELW